MLSAHRLGHARGAEHEGFDGVIQKQGLYGYAGIRITEADRNRLVMRKGKFLRAEARAFMDLMRAGPPIHREQADPTHSQR